MAFKHEESQWAIRIGKRGDKPYFMVHIGADGVGIRLWDHRDDALKVMKECRKGAHQEFFLKRVRLKEL